MYKLIALYQTPENPDEFWAHYNDVHLPLVRKVPGLAKLVVSRVTANAMGGEAPFFMIVEMAFPDRATFDAAMASPENRAAGRDLMSFAGGKVVLMAAEEI